MTKESPAVPADLTPTIFCTKTNRIIDTCLPGQEGAVEKLARHSKDYGPNLIVVDFDEAWRRAEDAAKTEPAEIDEEAFQYGLNVLPPARWHVEVSRESFKISERLTGAITAIYVRLGTRYFTFNDDIRKPHEACCARVLASHAYADPAQEREAPAAASEPEETPGGKEWPSRER